VTNTFTRTGFVVAASLGLVALAAYGQSELRFKVKYDLEINVSPESRSVGSRVYIRDGSVIPIEIGQYQAEIKISGTSPGYYEVELSVAKGADGTEADQNVARVSFSGEDGVPVWFDWRTAEIHIKMQLVASGDRR
jgi:hypothetical protein